MSNAGKNPSYRKKGPGRKPVPLPVDLDEVPRVMRMVHVGGSAVTRYPVHIMRPVRTYLKSKKDAA